MSCPHCGHVRCVKNDEVEVNNVTSVNPVGFSLPTLHRAETHFGCVH